MSRDVCGHLSPQGLKCMSEPGHAGMHSALWATYEKPEEWRPNPCWCPYCGEPHGVNQDEARTAASFAAMQEKPDAK